MGDFEDRPFIAVTAPARVAEDSPTLRVLAESGYLKGAEIAQGVPLIISPALEERTSSYLLERAGGVILTGGEDVAPARYGEPDTEARNVSPERDALELQVAERALERGMPILAICRGMQLLNVLLGGSLFQDLPAQQGTDRDHDRAGREVSRAIHEVRVEGTELLDGVFRDETFHANSTHHQGLRELGDGLVPVAWSEDGVVEAVEYRDGDAASWIVGIQWHPERMLDEATGTNRRIFERFGEAVRDHQDEAS